MPVNEGLVGEGNAPVIAAEFQKNGFEYNTLCYLQ
jgi:hypothetical protein